MTDDKSESAQPFPATQTQGLAKVIRLHPDYDHPSDPNRWKSAALAQFQSLVQIDRLLDEHFK